MARKTTPSSTDDNPLWAILESTAAETGERYFAGLVQRLAQAMETCGAWITEYLEESHQLQALAFWMDGNWIEGYKIDIAGTPCEAVIGTANLVHFPDRLLDLFPDAPQIREGGFVSYLGVPLKDADGRLLGHMAVIDRAPMPDSPKARALFQIFAERAAAELRRLRVESELRAREEKLSRVVNGAMDAIIELDAQLAVTLLNPAAERMFGCESRRAVGLDFRDFLTPEGGVRLAELAAELQGEGRASAWIAGGLDVTQLGGDRFAAEATLSRFAAGRRHFFALVLRNVNDRLEAERRIHSLEVEAACLRDELQQLNGPEILGRSPALRQVLEEVRQVAATNATVLIQGETGTGKELFARAIHTGSLRHGEPMITVNCAAIPATLIESEFFGHEKGAFTGATAKREGRFALADRGTIFLDEIGELPLDLQAKLLRVLQEGSFEPVGSGRTQQVDVRVVAATNRDLRREVAEGRFREDLFYRLNVFPIRLPSLRERPEDIPLLAEAFAGRFAKRLREEVAPLTPECQVRLKAYAWPGNVRELENVMERAVITAVGGRMNLARALPEATPAPPVEGPAGAVELIYSVEEMAELERQNFRRALERCEGRVSGEQGAARLLGLKPSTLASRLKALGVRRAG
ncbi:MAG: sigma 54-interacting transcriptional regulator [Chthoniobacter sp.]|uniref:sigma 54-interacting transcriptional regulator n=1 Tax=Chthoniobacter sp. TaxID=2510640 RepID=UPI0032A59E49